MSMPLSPPEPRRVVHPAVVHLASYSWRLLTIGLLAAVVIAGLVRLRVVLFPVVVATFLTVALSPVARRLRHRRVPAGLASALALLLLFAVLGAVVAVVVPTVADELGDIGPTVTEATDSLERWLIDDVGVTEERLEQTRAQLADALRASASGSSSRLVGGAILLGEVVAGTILTLFLTFFMVKDGERFQRFVLGQVPETRRELVARLASRGWRTLGGYLRGSALLGIVEATIIGTAMGIVGASLIPAVMAITFLAAFVPFVGAIVAGVLATAVTLATAGTGPALIIGITAIVVQQLDNDILAPVVFGKALDLHPVAVLLSVAAGGAIGGLPLAILAVPLTALAFNLVAEWRAPEEQPQPT
jgi:putative heme transporter